MRRIVITGASSQIGQAIAAQLASPDAHLILHGFRNGAALAASLQNFAGTYEIMTVDFTRQEELDRFCGALGEVDVLVNAAACTKTALLPDLADGDIAQMIAVNIIAMTKICRAVLPAMMVRRSGVIVNITSITALRANRGQTVYAGTKGFAEAFTRSLAAEYGSRGIRANCVAPGAIDAGSLKELLSYAGTEVRRSTALGRLGTPDDVAAAVAFLCGPEATFINGATLPVSGGFLSGV